MANDQNSNTCIRNLLLPQGLKLGLFLLYMQKFQKYKNPYLGMTLEDYKVVSKVTHVPLSTPWVRNWAYFPSTGSGFLDTCISQYSKLPYFVD